MSSPTSSKKLLPVVDDINLTELISSLPKEERWNNALADLYQYQGFWYPLIMFKGILSFQQKFQAQPNDVIIAGAPKTGNTWLKALCFAISTRNCSNYTTTRSLSKNLPHSLIPILEFGLPNSTTTTTNPRLLSTHLPHVSLPRSILSSGCKIIYVCREPKDTFVSMWHYQRRMESIEETYLDMDREFDRFCEGKVALGPYLDHVLGYYEASLENPDRFLFFKYEDMKRDTVGCVKTLAAFMDKGFSVEEEGEGLVEEIAKRCSFEELSELDVNKNGKSKFIGQFMLDNNAFFRKGTVGDWRNYLTLEMWPRGWIGSWRRSSMDPGSDLFGTE